MSLFTCIILSSLVAELNQRRLEKREARTEKYSKGNMHTKEAHEALRKYLESYRFCLALASLARSTLLKPKSKVQINTRTLKRLG